MSDSPDYKSLMVEARILLSHVLHCTTDRTKCRCQTCEDAEDMALPPVPKRDCNCSVSHTGDTVSTTFSPLATVWKAQ